MQYIIGRSGRVAPPLPPESQFRGQGIHHTASLLRDLIERCVTGKHLWTVVVQNTIIRMMRKSNDHSNCALCSRV